MTLRFLNCCFHYVSNAIPNFALKPGIPTANWPDEKMTAVGVEITYRYLSPTECGENIVPLWIENSGKKKFVSLLIFDLSYCP